MLGGIMLGTASSNLFAMITANQYPTIGVVISAVFLLAGLLWSATTLPEIRECSTAASYQTPASRAAVYS
jgi:hypothetical protein